MSLDELHGACSCGRNTFIIIPSPTTFTAQILFDESANQRRTQSIPFPTFLRIPLSWLHSTTYALYPDETHSTIRRVFTPRHAPQTKQHFCGFCGTTLTHWSEEGEDEADLVNVSLQSLSHISMARLGEGAWEGVLPIDLGQEEEGQRKENSSELAAQAQGREIKGVPWFEEMVEGSALGRLRRRRGWQTSADGSSTLEWEVVEFEGGEGGDGAEGGSATKRKIGEVGGETDVEMRSGP